MFSPFLPCAYGVMVQNTRRLSQYVFPISSVLSCSHVLVSISTITKTDIRDLCGAFHLNIRDRIAQWREQPHWNRMQVYLSVWIMPGSNPDSCLLIVCFQTCQWSDGLDVLIFKCPLSWCLSTLPFFFFLGKLEGAMLFSPFHE